jgi:hypothetical protein
VLEDEEEDYIFPGVSINQEVFYVETDWLDYQRSRIVAVLPYYFFGLRFCQYLYVFRSLQLDEEREFLPGDRRPMRAGSFRL